MSFLSFQLLKKGLFSQAILHLVWLCSFPATLSTQDLGHRVSQQRRAREGETAKMVSGLINANPVVHERKQRRIRRAPSDVDEYDVVEPIDQQEIFDILLFQLN
ncbi:hypothetical protein NE237_018937 [Protea cynaroides]|uniref:Uncharacterized protein n=1 Tax=Protea cynaroides TaxID=273540 RepID=A0A9Q0KAR9_9MAGN|nr:hypothetical protein NE237_018937 [Protea cynaroides]